MSFLYIGDLLQYHLVYWWHTSLGRTLCSISLNVHLSHKFLVAEGMLQEMQVHMEEEIISTKVGRQALETVKKI